MSKVDPFDFKKDYDSFDREFNKTSRMIRFGFGAILLINIAVLAFLAVVLVLVLKHFGIF